MDYEDFDLQVKAVAGDRYAVSVRSPAGETHARLVLSAAPGELRRAVGAPTTRGEEAGRHLGAVPASPESGSTSLRRLGRTLFEALLGGRVGALFHESLARVGPSRGLCLKLRFDLADPRSAEIASLPWEALYSERLGGHLAIRRRTPIVRYVEVPRPAGERPLPGRLRILVMASSPKGLPPLDLPTERARIEKAWAALDNVEVSFVERPTREGLAAALRDAAAAGRPHHVLHFMGHGQLDPATGRGQLLFTRDDGGPLAVGGEELATELADFQELRLVFLNACQSGASAGSDPEPFGGVAASLVRTGVPAVVAMQRPISDRAALELSRVLYGRIAVGDRLETAVTEARLALDRDADTAAEWSTPVLFLRLPDGRLFEPRSPQRVPWWRRPAAAALLAVLLVGAIATAYLARERDPCAQHPSNQVLALTEEAARSADARRYDEAAESLRSALELDPHNAGVHSALGYVALEQGRYTAARESLTRAARELPDCAVHAFNLGSFHLLRKEYEQSAQELRRALRIDPDRTAASAALGYALFQMGGLDAAREVLGDGLRRVERGDAEPTRGVLSSLHANLGRVALAQDAPDEAVRHLDRALELLPDEDRRRLELIPASAEARAAAGRRAEACDELQALLPVVGREVLTPWERRATELQDELQCVFEASDSS